MTRLQRIEKIAAKSGSMMTDADRAYIVKTSQVLGIEFVPRPHCLDCYSDQAIVLRRALKDAQAKQTESAYILRDGVDVIFCGMRINKDTLTDSIAERILSLGFNKRFFAVCK